MNISEKIADLAIEWANLEVPYRHRGMTRRGCDCTGLILGIAKELKLLNNYVLPQYRFDWNLHAGATDIITAQLEKVSDVVPNSSLQKGDILVFNFGKCAAHVGIYIKDNLFVHSRARQICKYGCTVNSEWSSRWVKTYRFNERKMGKL